MSSYLHIHEFRLQKSLSIINSLKPNTILEIGCFPPQALLLPLRQNYRVTGICSDFEPVDLPDVHTLNIETDAFPFKPNSFDLVLLCEVIEHMTNYPPTLLLAKIHTILKPGGHLLITTPNSTQLKNLARSLFRLRAPAGDNSPYSAHHHEYSLSELANLLNASSFTLTLRCHIDFYTPFRSRSKEDSRIIWFLKLLAFGATSAIPPTRDSLMVVAQKPSRRRGN